MAIETRLKRSPIQVSSARQWHGNKRGVVQVRWTSETEHPNVTLCLDHLNKPTIKDFSRQRNLNTAWGLNVTKEL